MLQHMITNAADNPTRKAASGVRSHHDQFATKRLGHLDDLVCRIATGNMSTDLVIRKIHGNRRQVSLDGFDRNAWLDRYRCKFTNVTRTRFPDMQEVYDSAATLRFVYRQRDGRKTGGTEIDRAKHRQFFHDWPFQLTADNELFSRSMQLENYATGELCNLSTEEFRESELTESNRYRAITSHLNWRSAPRWHTQ